MLDSGEILFAIHEGFCVLKLRGTLTFRNSACFISFLKATINKSSIKNVIFDLQDCEYLDSTIIGIIAITANSISKGKHRKPVISSAPPQIRTILETMGFDKGILLKDEENVNVAEMNALPESPASLSNYAAIVLEAHKALMSMNDKNKSLFRNIVDSLENQIQ